MPEHLKFSVPIMELNGQEFLDDTPGHEMAHVIALYLHGAEGRFHDSKWAEVMELFGQAVAYIT
jgi:predicted SprT family Zn-dependent metalloprotease